MSEISFFFYGQVKNYTKDIFESFEKNIFNPVCEYFKADKVSKYLVTFNNKEIYNPRNNENNPIDYLSIFKYIKFDKYKIINVEDEEISKIDNISKELIKRFGGSWGPDSHYSTIYAVRQLYSLMCIKKLCENNNKISIMIRPDIKFLNKINLNNINLDKYDMLVPNFYTNAIHCNDRFSICLNNKAFETYCARFERFLLLENTYNSEHFLMKQLKENNINFHKIDIKFVRIRADNQIEGRDFYLFKDYLVRS